MVIDAGAFIAMQCQHVDDDGPVVASIVAIPEELPSDRVAVGLVVDQDAPKGAADRWARGEERVAEFSIPVGMVVRLGWASEDFRLSDERLGNPYSLQIRSPS